MRNLIQLCNHLFYSGFVVPCIADNSWIGTNRLPPTWTILLNRLHFPTLSGCLFQRFSTPFFAIQAQRKLRCRYFWTGSFQEGQPEIFNKIPSLFFTLKSCL